MKKLIRTAGFLFAALALTACDEDYTDWANPQTHPQENPADAVSAVIQALPEATIDREQAPDTVALVSLPTLVNVPEGSQAKVTLPGQTQETVYAPGTHSVKLSLPE